MRGACAPLFLRFDKFLKFCYNIYVPKRKWRVGRAWLNASALKVVKGVSPSRVRIPHSPPGKCQRDGKAYVTGLEPVC